MTFNIGDDVFVREPQRYSPGCTCIVGPVVESRPLGSAMQYRVDAEIGFQHPVPNRKAKVWVHAVDLGHRVGVPLSQINGNAAQRHIDPEGWANWCQISGEFGL